MQNDEVIWSVINGGFCSFRTKTRRQNFCRNRYNVSGLCQRTSCPLANSRYATVLENRGVSYLYMKTVERAHSPKNLWEKVPLSKNYETALKQLDEHLAFWPKGMVHRCKQRHTKIVQYLMRVRRIQLKGKGKLVGIVRSKERVLEKRESKALVAAQIQTAIEKELLERFRKGTYDGIQSFPQRAYEKALDAFEDEEGIEEYDDDDDEEEFDEDDEMEMDEADDEDVEGAGERMPVDDDNEIAFVEAYDDDDDDDDDEMEDLAAIEEMEKKLAMFEKRGKRKHAETDSAPGKGDGKGGEPKKPAPGKKKPKQRKKAHVTIEYEREEEHEAAPAEADLAHN